MEEFQEEQPNSLLIIWQENQNENRYKIIKNGPHFIKKECGFVMSKNNTKKELKMIRNSMSLEQLSKDQKMKYEIAKELGLYDKVIEHGWKSLSAKETGKIGGIMTRKKKEEEREKKRGVSVEDIDTDIDGINDVLKHEDSPKL